MSLVNIFTLDLDLKDNTYMTGPSVTASDTVRFIVNITDDGLPFDLTGMTSATIAHTRYDGIVVIKTGTKTGTNQLTFDFGSTEILVPGRVEAKIQMYDSTGRVSVVDFSYMVTKDPSGGAFVPSVDEKTLIETVLIDGPQVIADAQAVVASVDAAVTNATNAATAATNAATSVGNAATAANNAATAANTAKTNADAATTAANNAATAANTAKTNADAATTAANNAANAANTAKTNADTATSAANTAKTNADTATTNANNAATAANTAKTNADAATSAANTAKTNADSATSAANAAATAANTAIANLNHMGTYNGSTAYLVKNIVDYNGSSYMCILNSTGNIPTNTTYWKPMGTKGDQGIQGIPGTPGSGMPSGGAAGNFLKWSSSGVATWATPAITSLSDVALASPTNGQFLKFNGTSWVNANVSIATALAGLTDVALSSPTNGQFLKFNGTSWVNADVTVASALAGLTDVTLTTPASGQLLRFNGTKWVNTNGIIDDGAGSLTLNGAVTLPPIATGASQYSRKLWFKATNSGNAAIQYGIQNDPTGILFFTNDVGVNKLQINQSGAITTPNATIDDGSGNSTLKGLIVNGNVTIKSGVSRIDLIETDSTQTGNEGVRLTADGDKFIYLQTVNSSGVWQRDLFKIDRANGAFGSKNNTLDDGTGKATFAGDINVSGQTRISSTTPILLFNETDGAVDAKKWRFVADAGAFGLRILNDAENSETQAMSFDRSGNMYVNGAIDATNIQAGNTPGTIVKRDPWGYVFASYFVGALVGDLEGTADGNMAIIKVKRFNKSGLGTLSDGELGYAKDTNELYIGTASSGNKVVGGGTQTVMSDITTDGQVTGDILVATMASSCNVYDPLYMSSTGYNKASSSNPTQMVTGLCLETGTGERKVLKRGYVRNDAWNWTPGATIYISTNGLTNIAPTISGQNVQVVGYAESADVIYFNPSYTVITI